LEQSLPVYTVKTIELFGDTCIIRKKHSGPQWMCNS